MKYVMSWTPRPGGSGADNEAAQRRALDVFSKWSPAVGVTFHQFLARLDDEGGFSVVETDDPRLVLSDTSKFAPWFEFHIFLVVDMQDAVPTFNVALDVRSSIS